jgi:hypothetical protein
LKVTWINNSWDTILFNRIEVKREEADAGKIVGTGNAKVIFNPLIPFNPL